MSKKFKLVIPQEISKGCLLTAVRWIDWDNKELTKNQVGCVIEDGLKDWLREIKEPKKDCSVAYNDLAPDKRPYGSFTHYENGWLDCEKNRGYDE